MSIELSREARSQAIATIERYFNENMEQRIGDIAAGALLSFFLEEIVPTVYNSAVAEVQERMQARVLELDIEIHEDFYTGPGRPSRPSRVGEAGPASCPSGEPTASPGPSFRECRPGPCPSAKDIQMTTEGFVASHAHDAKFERGLRSFYEYRDLGIKAATKGRVDAHVIRAAAGKEFSSQPHLHKTEFQLVYILKGWIEFEYEGQGVVRLEAGSCVHQPPNIRHRELGHSDDIEMLEVVLPAGFATEEIPSVNG